MMRFFQHERITGSVFCAFMIAIVFSAIYGRILYRDAFSCFLQISMSSSVENRAKLYLDTGRGLSEQEVVLNAVRGGDQFHTYDFPLPRKNIHYLRFDPFESSGVVAIKSIAVINGFGQSLLSMDLHVLRPAHQIKVFDLKGHILNIITEDHADDPQIAISLSSPLLLDSFHFFSMRLFLVYLFVGFLAVFITFLFLIWTLRKWSIGISFFDHPGRASFSWMKQNRIFLSAILCLLAFRVFFVLTYPLDTCSDAGTYYLLIQNGMSTLVHATGYPYLMNFFSFFLPTKTDLLIFQHVIDFGTQLIVMILLKKRFGLVAAITAGVCYGLELRAINWVSRSTPEWLQGVFFALAFAAAIEAYFAGRPAKKIFLYLLSAWLFTWSVLVKFLTMVMLPIYLILFILESKQQWKGRWLCSVSMCLLFLIQSLFFIYFYHFPSTGTKAPTLTAGWILNEKVRSFLPAGLSFSESGPWSKRYRILISEMPGSSSEINIHEVYRHVDAVSRSIRKPYQERYRELSGKSDDQLEFIINTNYYVKDLDQNFLISNYYLGLSETDDLLKKVFLEMIVSYPKEYLFNVMSGIMESFFIKTSYYIAIIHNPFSPDRDHPLQLHKNEIIQNLPWGYALFNVSPRILCSYEEPVFLKSGLRFFTSWGESVYIPTIIKWLFIVLATGFLYINYRKDKKLEPALLYLSMGILALFLFISLSNILFVFRDKEFQSCQHLMCILLGISVCSMISFGRLGRFDRKKA